MKFQNYQRNVNSLMLCASLLCSLQLSAQDNVADHATKRIILLKETKAGRKPASDLQYRQAGVPVFSFVKKEGNQVVKVKNIPQLDIGEEKQLEAKDPNFTPITKKELILKTFSKSNSPQYVEIDNKLLTIAIPNPAKAFQSPLHKEVPIVKAMPALPVFNFIDTPHVPVNVVEIKPEEYKMIQALIFLDYQKKYDLAMALFVELMDAPLYKDQAMFHYAQTALESKLFSEFRQKMIQVTQTASDVELKKKATEELVKNVKYLELSDIGLIDPIAEAHNIDTALYPSYLLKKAKYELDKGNLGEAESSLSLISPTANEYSEGQLLKSVFNYRQGQIDTAIQDLEIVLPLIENKTKDSTRNLTMLTLARLYFQKGDYTSAFKFYQKVDKSSGEWLQSMVEQAWTQVLAGDNVGAAGNMFALHTDFFSKAYAPETYVVRSVGYLNLCQYGDGVAVLNDFKTKYSEIHNTLKDFQSKNAEDMKYYELVKTWLKNTSAHTVEGVPRSFIVELARHPHYMSTQKQINNYEDENSRFNKITIDLIRKEKQARLEMLKAKNALTAAKAKSKSKDDLLSFEQNFLAKGVEHVIFSKAREGIKKMREAALVRLESEKESLRLKTASNIKKRFELFTSTLDQLIDQKEVLSYEIYSGAGEHIRYQMAGGEVKPEGQRAIASEKNNYEWKHKGEVWEDEIGHYRSSLKNVCPKDDSELAQTND